MSDVVGKYRQLFSDVVQGFSAVKFPSFGLLYIKHLNNLDIAEINFWNDIYLQEAKDNGILTYDEKLQYLLSNNIWSPTKEEKIKNLKSLLITYENNRDSQFLKSKRTTWINEIFKIEKELKYLEFEKESLIKDTSETIARRKSNLLHIIKSFFKDSVLTLPAFDKNYIDTLDDNELNELFDLFNRHLEKFRSDNLKRLSISSVFLNLFYLSPESVYEFYGKPVIQLTTYQIETYSFGKYFRSIMNEYNDKIPKDILQDPDKIIEYVELNKNYKKAFPDNKENDAGSLVGASKEDYKILGMNPSNKIGEELKKKGNLKMDDLLKITE